MPRAGRPETARVITVSVSRAAREAPPVALGRRRSRRPPGSACPSGRPGRRGRGPRPGRARPSRRPPRSPARPPRPPPAAPARRSRPAARPRPPARRRSSGARRPRTPWATIDVGARLHRAHRVLHRRGHRDAAGAPAARGQVAHRRRVAQAHADHPRAGREAGLHQLARAWPRAAAGRGLGGQPELRAAAGPAPAAGRRPPGSGGVGRRDEDVDRDRRAVRAHARATAARTASALMPAQAERAEPAGLGDGGHQLGRRRASGHARQHHRMADPEAARRARASESDLGTFAQPYAVRSR